MYGGAPRTHLSSFPTPRWMGQPREGREEPTLPEGGEEAMDGTGVRISFLPNRQRPIKDLTEM